MMIFFAVFFGTAAEFAIMLAGYLFTGNRSGIPALLLGNLVTLLLGILMTYFLMDLDYNRVVKDLNGMTPIEFLRALEQDFVVMLVGPEEYKPRHRHEFSLYIDGNWYSLTARPGTYDDNDPIGCLDVDISSRLILDKLMGIKDLRSDKRIDFVGGLRGLGELRRRVDNGEARWALALYPVSMDQIMKIADAGKIMPPKATWFEPKLRSGLVIHKLSD